MTLLLVLALLLTLPIALIGGKTLWTRRVCRKRGHNWALVDPPTREYGWICSRCKHTV